MAVNAIFWIAEGRKDEGPIGRFSQHVTRGLSIGVRAKGQAAQVASLAFAAVIAGSAALAGALAARLTLSPEVPESVRA